MHFHVRGYFIFSEKRRRKKEVCTRNPYEKNAIFLGAWPWVGIFPSPVARDFGGLTVRNRGCRGSGLEPAGARPLPNWGVRGAWGLGAHNPTPDLELWSRRGVIKQPFGGVVRDIVPEGDGRGTTLEVGGVGTSGTRHLCHLA